MSAQNTSRINPHYKTCTARLTQEFDPESNYLALDTTVDTACFVTDTGKVGYFQVAAPGPAKYIGMESVNVTYTIWNASLP